MPPRSFLQLDVKDLAPPGDFWRPLSARVRRMHLISVGVVAAAAVYLLTIAPSDSTARETAGGVTTVTVGPAESIVAESVEIIAPADVAEVTVETVTDSTVTDITVTDTVAADSTVTTADSTVTTATVTTATVTNPTVTDAPAIDSAVLLARVDSAPRPAVSVVASAFDAAARAARPVPVPPAQPDFDWTTATVKKRDTLSQLFKRHGISVADAYAVAALDGAERLRAIRPGQILELAAGDDGELLALRYRLDPLTTLQIRRAGANLAGKNSADTADTITDKTFTAATVTRAPDIRISRARGVINSSLLAAAKRAGLDFETTYAFAHLFDWQVDFAREIRTGDAFALIFEEQFLDGEKIANGDIIAAELTTRGRALQAVRHIDADGRRAYYAPNGDGIQRSFLRSPVEFGRVTSNFSHRRFHPILKKWRPHRGVDYGAPTGTPVRATGDGVVTTAKRKYGYGKTVIIRHGEKYTTLYAHLSTYAKGVKPGARIAQGDVIGRVGATGWATGPHLHYEFRVGGVHQNPLTVELPKSDPIAARYKEAFVADAARWMARLPRGDGDGVGDGGERLAQLDGDGDGDGDGAP